MHDSAMTEDNNRREFYRYDMLLPLKLYLVSEGQQHAVNLRKPLETSCVNASGGGILIVSPHDLQPSQYLFMQITVPECAQLVSAVCQVVRAQPRTFQGKPCWYAACRFVLIKEADQDRLIKYILHESLEHALDELAHRTTQEQISLESDLSPAH